MRVNDICVCVYRCICVGRGSTNVFIGRIDALAWRPIERTPKATKNCLSMKRNATNTVTVCIAPTTRHNFTLLTKLCLMLCHLRNDQPVIAYLCAMQIFFHRTELVSKKLFTIMPHFAVRPHHPFLPILSNYIRWYFFSCHRFVVVAVEPFTSQVDCNG